MKIVMPLLFLLIPFALFGQRMSITLPGPQRDYTGGNMVPLKPYNPIDPLREVDGIPCAVNPADTNNWAVFAGTVLQVHGNGVVRIQGQFTGHPYAEFVVVNFPYDVVESQMIGYDSEKGIAHYAKIAGTYTYATAMGSTRTIYKLDYGKIYTPPPLPPLTAEQIEARKAAESEKIKKANAKTVQWLEDLAATNDVYGERRLAEKYLHGDGVETNAVKARELLTRAAAQGDKESADMLGQINSK